MNISGKFLKVWEVEDKGSLKLVNLGDSRKNRDGSYDKWTWFKCAFVGKAKDLPIKKGDTIEIVSGIIYQEKYNDKWQTRVTIFDANVTAATGSSGFEDDVPF